MQTAAEYLEKTKSAVLKLFEGIESYVSILKSSPTPCLVIPDTDDYDYQYQFEAWELANESRIAASHQAREDFIAESFAQATLCGSVLQVAAKALERYSDNENVPSEWVSVIKPKSNAVQFCIGRLVRDVPIGLIIYAARNQHMHFNCSNLHETNRFVFERLATNYSAPSDDQRPHPAFDLKNPGLVSYASNVIDLLGWYSYDAYEKDMHQLLKI